MPFIVRKYFLVCCLLLTTQTAFGGHGNGARVGIDEIQAGQGDEAVPYSVVDVHYTGKLENGSVFDSSKDRGKPFRFTLGSGQVIPGWDIGIQGMRQGAKRILTIPPELGYGAGGSGNVIPPNSTLIFEVELVAVAPPSFASIDNEQLEAKLDKGIKLFDIRRAEEWKQTGVVDGSIKSTAFDSQGRFIPSFAEMLKEAVQPDEEFAVICRTGNRTAALSNWLATTGGYKNVLNVEGGIVSWIEQGRSVDKSGG